MKKRWGRNSKRLLAGIIALVMMVTTFPATAVTAMETREKYPYTLFAASETEGAITITGNVCINGDIATNGTVAMNGSTINVNGAIHEQADEKMIAISAKLDKLYFAGANVVNYESDYCLEEVNCNIFRPTVVKGNMNAGGNVNLNAPVKVSGDISVTPDSLNGNNAVLYSENGDIHISGMYVNLTGLIYAPKGEVCIKAQNVNLNNVIVIADRITFETGNANINYSQNMAEIIGVYSEEDTTEPDEGTTGSDEGTTKPEDGTTGSDEGTTKPEDGTTEPDDDSSVSDGDAVEPDENSALCFLLGYYDTETHSVNMEWYTNVENPEVTLWTSADNVTYGKVASVTGVTSYQYVIEEDFETKYFKATIRDGQGHTAETIPFLVNRTENGYSVSKADSDGDGVSDEFELLVGTDGNNPDTDGDTLTDYEELYVCHTTATKYDSVTEGVSDAQADTDGDRLSNREEIENGTYAQFADSDEDGLTDYEEIRVYHTDPLKADTDGDGLKDGDEIALGLDPWNPETFGIPDSEYKAEQNIPADSETLKEINTPENEYRLSLAVTASGYVEGSLTATETGYAAAIQNEFMVGMGAELSCANEDGIETVTLTFAFEEEAVGESRGLFPGVEELSGIKRFNVFKYFEDYNMLLPIETVVDEENNRISATTDELGTYCVMDMEGWLASFDVPEEVYREAPVLFSMRPGAEGDELSGGAMVYDAEISQDMEPANYEMIMEESAPEVLAEAPMLYAVRGVRKTPVDVVFILQAAGFLESIFNSQRTMVYELFEDLETECGRGNVRFSVITYSVSGTKILTTSDGATWFEDGEELQQALSDVKYVYESDYVNRGEAFSKLRKEVEFKENSAKFIFQLINGANDVSSGYIDQLRTCKELGINYSELKQAGFHYIYPDYEKRVEEAIAATNGMNATFSDTSLTEVYEHILTYAAPPQVNFEAIVPTGWKKILLDGILDPENGVNSDTDAFTDWEEVDTYFLSWDTDGTVILPTIQECIEEVESGYAQTGLERFKARKGEHIPSVNAGAYIDYVLGSTHILPIYSDPTLADSDGDGWKDHEDSDKLKVNTNLDEELSQALFDALNDYLNQIMPPVYDENGEKITNKNKECIATWNHFNEYIWPALLENGDKPEQRHAAYIVWLRDAYGLNGAEKIWLTSERYVETFYYELIDEDIVERAFKQVTMGNYYDDVTLTGTAGQITLGVLGVDFVADIRDITYDIDHWEFTWSHMGQTAVDMVALSPIIGAIKYSDEFVALAKISKVESTRMLNELTEMANRMSQMGHSFDEITNAGKVALRSKKIELITENIVDIANQYDNLQCKECAKSIRNYLEKNGMSGIHIKMQCKTDSGNYIGNIALKSEDIIISSNGTHEAILFNNKVYDNIYPNGIEYEEWLNNFDFLFTDVYPDFAGNINF